MVGPPPDPPKMSDLPSGDQDGSPLGPLSLGNKGCGAGIL